MAPDSGETQSPLAWSPNDEVGSDVSDGLRARVKRELEPGERLLWSSKAYPQPAPLGAKFSLGLVALPVLILVALAFYANGMGHLGPLPRANDAAPILMGIVASTVGCALAAGLFTSWTNRGTEARRMANTSYAVTDRRAILWIPDGKTAAVRVTSVHRGGIERVVRVELPDGSGNIEMATGRTMGFSAWYPFGFRHIPDVRLVEQIIRRNLLTNEQSQTRSQKELT
jgi:hypothetical protein